jgi:hypothetical protein
VLQAFQNVADAARTELDARTQGGRMRSDGARFLNLTMEQFRLVR